MKIIKGMELGRKLYNGGTVVIAAGDVVLAVLSDNTVTPWVTWQFYVDKWATHVHSGIYCETFDEALRSFYSRSGLRPTSAGGDSEPDYDPNSDPPSLRDPNSDPPSLR